MRCASLEYVVYSQHKLNLTSQPQTAPTSHNAASCQMALLALEASGHSHDQAPNTASTIFQFALRAAQHARQTVSMSQRQVKGVSQSTCKAQKVFRQES
jgi:hypothetical protein